MKLGIVVPVELGRSGDPDWILQFAKAAESLGFDEISAVEHSVVIADTESEYPYSPTGKSHLPDDCDIPDPLELLSFVAGATTTLGLSTGVLVLPNHNPVVLAKRLATLDRLSGGRLRICLGLGWMKEEIEACGGDFERRGKTADEAIAVMRALWAGKEAVDFDGEYYSFKGAYSWPKPHSESGVPLYIGGHSLAAARRAGRLGNGFQPLGLAGEELDKAIAAMKAAAVKADRDPAEVSVVLGATLPRLDEAKLDWARGLGADRIVLSASRRGTSLELIIDEMTECSKRLGLTN
ncbi:LLM class F420-dependent oxidoreductase [Rhodococcus sp. SRB_17]|uniref:LLM class F420-dependent oxidoreductase n=1 Tax=Rhodococcus sp. OK302 TaxID=1882769 RepID=UPI000B9427BF|nr:LLM class F420-dependent oxidoreductase [Rhodococcus sp. OK302]NMM87621.1 LLM class F420-dependent oxidoreductase [Rhodococcus sp. SRB_17]OYD66834.1 putative F420-dependent oxidoreductase [Rhodococcus sp. OK302]